MDEDNFGVVTCVCGKRFDNPNGYESHLVSKHLGFVRRIAREAYTDVQDQEKVRITSDDKSRR